MSQFPFSFYPIKNICNHEENAYNYGRPGKHISMSYEVGLPVVDRHGQFDRCFGIPWLRIDDITQGIYKTTDSRVGAAGYPFSCFNGTESCIIHVLFVPGCITPPSIVGDDG